MLKQFAVKVIFNSVWPIFYGAFYNYQLFPVQFLIQIFFQSLLQVANTVKDKPVVVNKKKEVKEFEVGDRPMTK